jgi:large subunit ribosomal protein L17
MRHGNAGRKHGGDGNYRKAMFRTLTLSLIEHETIRTTPGRAKELRWFAERVVTLAKRNNLAGRRRIYQLLGSTKTNDNGTNRVDLAVRKLYDALVPRFQTRPGGYTQIFRLADNRPGDNAPMCLIRYIPVEGDKKAKGSKTPVKPTKKKASETKEAKAKPAKAAKEAPKEAKASDKAPSDKPAKKAKAKESSK